MYIYINTHITIQSYIAGGCTTAGIAAGWYAECNPTPLDVPADHGGD